MAMPTRVETRTWWQTTMLPVIMAQRDVLVAGGMTADDAKRYLTQMCLQFSRGIRVEL